MFVRPCFLVLDHEFAGSISTRKLVLETAKFNVITAYSCEEAIKTLELFPNVHGVVTNAAMAQDSCFALFTQLREQYPTVKLVIVGHDVSTHVPADRTVESFAPDKLLATLRELFPEQAAELQQTEDQLEIEIANAGS